MGGRDVGRGGIQGKQVGGRHVNEICFVRDRAKTDIVVSWRPEIVAIGSLLVGFVKAWDCTVQIVIRFIERSVAAEDGAIWKGSIGLLHGTEVEALQAMKVLIDCWECVVQFVGGLNRAVAAIESAGGLHGTLTLKSAEIWGIQSMCRLIQSQGIVDRLMHSALVESLKAWAVHGNLSPKLVIGKVGDGVLEVLLEGILVERVTAVGIHVGAGKGA